MIRRPAFSVEPWCLRETELHLDALAETESVFALSNGHIGWRANLDEGAPNGLPGSYLNGVYELDHTIRITADGRIEVVDRLHQADIPGLHRVLRGLRTAVSCA